MLITYIYIYIFPFLRVKNLGAAWLGFLELGCLRRLFSDGDWS